MLQERQFVFAYAFRVASSAKQARRSDSDRPVRADDYTKLSRVYEIPMGKALQGNGPICERPSRLAGASSDRDDWHPARATGLGPALSVVPPPQFERRFHGFRRNIQDARWGLARGWVGIRGQLKLELGQTARRDVAAPDARRPRTRQTPQAADRVGPGLIGSRARLDVIRNVEPAAKRRKLA